jgi:DNA-binding NarL/FixJ family response regulator
MYTGTVPTVDRPPNRAYLLSPHSFVLEELGRWLLPSGIPSEKIQLAYSLAPRPGPLAMKRGSVCVVDGCFPPAATESLVSTVLSDSPGARILVAAEELTEAFAFPLLRLGVKGLMTYAHTRREFLPALAAVAKGGYWVPRGLLSRFLDVLLAKAPPPPVPHTILSRREQDVLELLLQNLANKEIAGRLNISERTVKFHVSNLLAKFSVQRRADLILHSFQSHSIAPQSRRANLDDAPPHLPPFTRPRAAG